MTAVNAPRRRRASNRPRLKLPDSFKPSWEIVSLFPEEGHWSEEQYLEFSEKFEAGRFVELVDGRIEVLPVPTEEHQSIILFLIEALRAFTKPRKLGKVLFCGLRVRMRARNFRLPDVVYLSKKGEAKRGNRFWRGADLVMEVVSEDEPDRDYVAKRAEYARAGIREYWIVDPHDRTITLLVLKGRRYTEKGLYRNGDEVASMSIAGFAVRVSDVFDAANE